VGWELFLISVLILFLELACIRWFPAHVLFLTFFTNTVLLACFLGMSVGCLAANSKRNYLVWTPPLLVLGMLAAHGVFYLKARWDLVVDVGNQNSPQVVYFGTEAPTQDLARFILPVEAVGGFFFLLIALAMLGPGQLLGRALNRMTNRVQAYSLNILGSILGIVLFAALSWWQLSPLWWFLPVVIVLGYFLLPRPLTGRAWIGLLPLAVLLLAILVLADLRSGAHTRGQSTLTRYLTESVRSHWFPGERDAAARERMTECYWSPYYRIDYYPPPNRDVLVNQIGHQHMVPQEEVYPAYALPHLLNRDAGSPPFRDVLIIGAGTGNDVSRALYWGAEHVDAVEIDPVIQRLGAMDHPDRPYQDGRVTVHLDDGRNFLRATPKQYDLIVYALVDSLVLHSSYSNLRLESYLFTRQAFADAKRCLKPNGQFVVYNFFRQGWIVARLQKGLQEVFGSDNPLALTLPYQEAVRPEQELFDKFTVFFAGNTDPLRTAFKQTPRYALAKDRPPTHATPNGFRQQAGGEADKASLYFGLATIVQPETELLTSSDNWPFLYLRQPMLPTLSLKGIAIMGGLALLLILVLMPKGEGGGWRAFDGRMFFLGAGFMLVETKAVVQLALLFGSTWIVNSVVFFAVLVMILIANLYVLFFKPERLWPYYVGLLASLALNWLVPLDFFLGLDRSVQVVGACLLVFTPILFAGVIFAVSFRQCAQPDYAFGANIAGAMLGGLLENASMVLGFQHLVLLAAALYALSALRGPSPAFLGGKSQPVASPDLAGSPV
jgi:SAM-dependent methyltransferase